METFYNKLRTLLEQRESNESKVYKDSTGNLTAGIGHKLTAGELVKYKEGDVIPDNVIEEWYKKDTETSVNAAMKQAKELGIDNEDFLVNLTSVNFQLGQNWNKKFPSAYQALKDKRYDDAIKEINTTSKGEPSLWKTQSPTRVNDFQQAIEGLKQPTISEEEMQKMQINQVLSDDLGMKFNLDAAMYYGFGMRKKSNKGDK